MSRKPKIHPDAEATYRARDTFASDLPRRGTFVAKGTRRSGSDDIVRAHPQHFQRESSPRPAGVLQRLAGAVSRSTR